MMPVVAAVAVLSLAVFAALVAIPNRRIGGMLGQVGIVLAAFLLFAANAANPGLQPAPQPALLTSPVLLAAGVGLMAATLGGMGYHLFLGRFASLWPARAVFFAVSLGLAATLGAALMYLA